MSIRVPAYSDIITNNMAAQLNLMDLPPEIWLHIFSFVSQHDLYFNVSKTCCAFQNYAMDGSLWHYLDLHGISSTWAENDTEANDEVGEHAIMQLLSGLTDQYGLQEKIEHVMFSRYLKYSIIAENGLVYLQKFSNLKELDVGFCDDINKVSMERICKSIKTLTILNIEGCKNVTDSSLEHIDSLELLSSINISYCAMLTDDCLLHLYKLKCLLSFISDGVMRLTNYGIISFLNVQSNLKELVLDGEILTDNVCEMAAKSLEYLEVFELSFADNITNYGMAAIAKMNLRKIKLRKLNGISKQSLERLFCTNELMLPKKFTSIFITDLDTMDDGILTIISKTCPGLKQLFIDWCWNVSDNGVDEITKHCEKLNVLSLVGLFKLSGTTWLKYLHNRLPYLKVLDMSDCNDVVDRELILMARRMPFTEVYTYYHERVMMNQKSSYYTGIPTESDESDNDIKCAGELGISVDF